VKKLSHDTFVCNFAKMLTDFQNSSNDRLTSKFAIIKYPITSLGLTPFEFRGDLWQQKTRSLGYRVALLA